MLACFSLASLYRMALCLELRTRAKHIWKPFKSLLTNVILGRKCLARTNTLEYLAGASAMKKKFNNISTWTTPCAATTSVPSSSSSTTSWPSTWDKYYKTLLSLLLLSRSNPECWSFFRHFQDLQSFVTLKVGHAIIRRHDTQRNVIHHNDVEHIN
jgi:hypothetical protein